MVERAATVQDFGEVRNNILRFNSDLVAGSDLIHQLAQFRHWYYIPDLDAFGPSKFIGYKGMDASKYNRGHGGKKNGGRTEQVLRRWFVTLAQGSPSRARLLERLSGILAAYDKAPNKAASIHVPAGWNYESREE